MRKVEVMREYKVGQDIVTACGKCKLRTWHVIFAMDAQVIKRVQCKQCMSYHNYKPDPEDLESRSSKSAAGVLRRREGTDQTVRVGDGPAMLEDNGPAASGFSLEGPTGSRATKEPKAPGAKTTRSRKVVEEPDHEALWNEALKGRDIEQMSNYRADANYLEGTVLNHPLFGVGVITKVSLPPEKRMTVVFRDGSRQLACRLGG